MTWIHVAIISVAILLSIWLIIAYKKHLRKKEKILDNYLAEQRKIKSKGRGMRIGYSKNTAF